MRVTGNGKGRRAGSFGDARADRGSVLVLVPAGFLVLVVMAALAVDSAVAYRDQNELHDTLTAAANDAVTAGLSDRSFYGGGRISLDPGLVAASVCQSIEAQDVGSSLHRMQVGLAISGNTIEVTGSATVTAVFGRAVPGVGRRSIRSSADAVVTAGGPDDALPTTAIRSTPVTPLSCPSTL